MTKTRDSMLELQSVTKVYPDGTRAVQNLSFKIPEGQFCVLLGSSGAGKSTLLKLLNGIVKKTAGEIVVNGATLGPRSLRQVRSQISTIHQNFNLVPRLSVEKNVLSGALAQVHFIRALLHAFPVELRRKACKLIDSVGLEEKHLYRRATELSGGQQQRVGIARAFILDPKLVLADEPVASLDPNISRTILNILRNAARERGTTVLCSLHQVELAREFGERILGMRNGEIVFDGSASELTKASLAGIYGGDPEKQKLAPETDTASQPEPVLVGQADLTGKVVNF